MLRYTYKEFTSFSLILLLMVWAFYLLDSVHGRWVESRVRTNVAEQLVQQSVMLGNALNNKLSLLYGLRSFVETRSASQFTSEEFDNIAATLRGNSAAIRGMQLVKNGVITNMYPLKGNEAALGHNLLEDPRPAVAVSVRRAYENDFVTINGPLELKQGGQAIVARLPIRAKGKVWGLAAIIIDLPELFMESGLDTDEAGLLFAVRDQNRGTFFGSEEVFANTPEQQRIPLLDGYWDLAAAPKDGWLSLVAEQVLAFRIAGVIIILLLMTLFFVSSRSKYILHKLVDRRTQELELLNTELRHEVEARKRTEADLITARDKAQHSDRLKDAFIATMSHEIRTPLHVILGYVDLLHNPDDQSVSEEHAMYTQSMKSAGRRLMRSVEELLHISSLRAGTFKVDPEDFDLVESTRAVVREFREAAKERGLSLVLKSTLSKACIYADRYSLEQAITNLVDNAIKYTETGEVEIFLQGEGNDCTLRVKDTGIGISDEYIRHVFDVFSQEKIGYNRPYDGLGLGLSLTRQFVELNSGKIDVRSEKGKGSEFTLSFPTIMPVEHVIVEEERVNVLQHANGPSLTLIQTVAQVA
ncbi:MAG: CHASE domain-containing protein [Bacteroidetes bacterium]|nr:CHASE domain-containing protein [Bacteroidota bacterium]